MSRKETGRSSSAPITGGAGFGPDTPIDQAVSTRDEEPPYAETTPDAPAISPPGDAESLKQLRQENAEIKHKQSKP